MLHRPAGPTPWHGRIPLRTSPARSVGSGTGRPVRLQEPPRTRTGDVPFPAHRPDLPAATSATTRYGAIVNVTGRCPGDHGRAQRSSRSADSQHRPKQDCHPGRLCREYASHRPLPVSVAISRGLCRAPRSLGHYRWRYTSTQPIRRRGIGARPPPAIAFLRTRWPPGARVRRCGTSRSARSADPSMERSVAPRPRTLRWPIHRADPGRPEALPTTGRRAR